jgi:hypothetical protein
MKTLSKFLLLALVLSLTATAVSAAMPTTYYMVTLDSPCRLPDARGVPQDTVASKAAMYEVGDYVIQMDCLGRLPPGSEVPKAPTKLVFSDTKVYCATVYGERVLLTEAYTAIVSPNRMSQISCTFRIF